MPSEETQWVGTELPVSATFQLRAALSVAGRQEGYGSMDDLLAEAIHKEIRRLQRGYNHGRPWADEPAK